jgi:hypothetical protein
MTTVWTLEEGEDSEGGRILGVYGSKDAAFADFATAAASLHERFTGRGIDEAVRDEDGTLYLHAGCDWLSLVPREVITVPQLTAGATS